LAKARLDYKALHKSKTAKSPAFSYKYATLDDVYDCIGPALSKQGVAIVHQVTWQENVMLLITKLVHTSGQFFGAVMPLPTLTKMQEIGSALTYGKRYQVTGLAAISADDDDDGAAATAGADDKPKKGKAQKPDPETTVTVQPSEAQAYISAAKAKGMTNEQAKILMVQITGAEHSSEIPKDRYAALMQAVEGWQ
jgi:hypothetical protein